MAIKRLGANVPDFNTFRKRDVGRSLGFVTSSEDKNSDDEKDKKTQKLDGSSVNPSIAPVETKEHKNNVQNPADNKNVTIRAWVHVPIRGHCALFDQAVDLYGDTVAFNLISRSAVAVYDKALQKNVISKALADYPHTKSGVKMSRTISQDSYNIAQNIFDPLGLLPPGTLAALICKNALSYYFKQHEKQ